jgi:hypothetical protein
MFTNHLVEIEAGVFENQNATEPKSVAAKDHYTNNAIKILDDDKYHYKCLARKLKDTPIFAQEFHSVADIAGGHPKLASCLKLSGEVTVYDQYAAMYKKLHKEFLKRYPMDAPVTYEKKAITNSQFTPNAELAICSHILEHLSLKQTRKLLGNLETDKVIVYGPNIGVAKNLKWLHFQPSDHRTFCTIEAMCRLVAEAGFTVKFAAPYQEDYIIFGDK